jgi:hypothetical protein
VALTLLESRKLGDNEVLRNTVIEEYAKSSDILAALPFMDIKGNAYSYNRQDTLPGVGFRGVNAPYSESTGVVNPQTETLSIAGGDLDVDKFLIDTGGAGMREGQEMMKVTALSLAWTRQFIKGDSTISPESFDGIQSRVTGSQLMSAGNTSGGDQLSLMMLDDLIDLVDNPTHVVVNKRMKNLLSAASRQSSIGGFITYTPDEFGRKITHYQGLPLLLVDYDNDGNQIMPFTEANPGGGTPASTSIYAISMGDGKVCGLQGAVSGTYGIAVKDMGELQTKPAMRTRVDWYSGFSIMHGRAIARLQGIKNASILA